MSLRIGDDAPNFTAQATAGEIGFHQWLGDSCGIIYSHPADFTLRFLGQSRFMVLFTALNFTDTEFFTWIKKN